MADVLDNQDFADPAILHLFHGEGQAFQGDGGTFTGLGDFAQQLHHQAGNGVIVPFRQVYLQQVGNFVDGGAAVYGKGVFADPENLLFLVVIFVLNVAHNGLQQVFHGHNALGAAVFVHHNGNLDVAGGHFLQQLAAILAFRHEIGRAHVVGELHIRGNLGGDVFQHVLHIENAQNGVQLFVEYRHTGIALFHRQMNGFGQGHGVFHAHHLGAVGHDFTDGPVVKLEDIGDHLSGALVDDAFFLAYVHHHQDFLFRDGFLGMVGVNAHDPQHQIGGEAEEGNKGAENLCRGGKNAHKPEGKLFRFLHGDFLRYQLAQYQ